MAYAGPDRTVRVGAQVFISGLQSRDPSNLPLLYDWILISRPATSQVELAGRATVAAHFQADVVGRYEIELIVHNGSQPSAADRVTVTAVQPDVVIPGDVPNGVFNPAEVYIFGTLSEGGLLSRRHRALVQSQRGDRMRQRVRITRSADHRGCSSATASRRARCRRSCATRWPGCWPGPTIR
jgi:hypothetical protein